jgi:hypothetical protein
MYVFKSSMNYIDGYICSLFRGPTLRDFPRWIVSYMSACLFPSNIIYSRILKYVFFLLEQSVQSESRIIVLDHYVFLLHSDVILPEELALFISLSLSVLFIGSSSSLSVSFLLWYSLLYTLFYVDVIYLLIKFLFFLVIFYSDAVLLELLPVTVCLNFIYYSLYCICISLSILKVAAL